MERYKELSEEIKDSTGVKRYSTSYYPNIPFKTTDIYFYSKSRMRFDLLAYKYYGNAQLWWVIANANNMGKGTMVTPVGERIRVPYPLPEVELRDYIDAI